MHIYLFCRIATANGSDNGDDRPLFLGDIALGDSIDDIIMPSDICRDIVALFGSAISNFTLCSVTNARPIHLCEWCVERYLKVLETHREFLAVSYEAIYKLKQAH